MAFDPSRGWTLAAGVSVRPERFGALAYDFDSRRLSFLKSPALVRVVTTLSEHPDALSAFDAAGLSESEIPRYTQALATLAETRLIVPREAA